MSYADGGYVGASAVWSGGGSYALVAGESWASSGSGCVTADWTTEASEVYESSDPAAEGSGACWADVWNVECVPDEVVSYGAKDGSYAGVDGSSVSSCASAEEECVGASVA